MLFVHDRLFVFPNDVPLVVLLNPMPCFRLTCFRIIDGLDLLRCSCFAASVNPCRFDWSKDPARSAACTSGHEAHYPAHCRCDLRRHNLLEQFRRPVEFDLRLHQLAVHVGNGGGGERHLKRGHLTRVTLTVTY